MPNRLSFVPRPSRFASALEAFMFLPFVLQLEWTGILPICQEEASCAGDPVGGGSR